MEYNVLVNVGLVSRSLFGSEENEFNTSILPYAAISCFSEASDYKVSRSSFSCRIKTDLSKSQAAKALADKIAELTPDQKFDISVSESEGKAICKIGDESTITVSSVDSDDENVAESDSSEEKKSSYNQTSLDNLARNDNNNLIGWDSFKQYLSGIAKIAPLLNKTNTLDSLRSQCYLLSMNDGCGLTRAINDLTLLGYYSGAYSEDRYYEYVLAEETVGRRISLDDLIPYFKKADNKGLLMCVDVSAYTGKSTKMQLKKLLDEVVHNVKNMNFVFRIPYLEPKELKRIEDVLSDVLLLKTFVMPPYTDDQLLQFAAKFLKDSGMKMDDGAKKVFLAKIRDEKMDGCFYGIRTVRKVVDEIILMKLQKEAEKVVVKVDGKEEKGDEGLIVKEEIASLADISEKSSSSDPYNELYELVGMEKIAERVKEIVAQVKMALANDKLEKPCMHMRFLGAPGTGKTTVARIIGKIFAQNGILTNGHFFEYAGRDLCGQYVGQTAPKTLSICRDAYGSVLFLDEAYELYRSEKDDLDYGHEALATLIAEMENHRDNFVVIMAGYKKPMEFLMKGNVGLSSRMPFVIEFPSYNREQLVAIFMSMLKKHFKYEKGIEGVVKTYFDGLSDAFLNSEDFANARFVRNLYERTWSKAAMRTQMEGLTDVLIKKCDFITASQEQEFVEKLAVARNRVGY
ncbi:MAG: AAA family ATPase [Paludibacteraceae bacterium]|nr:AAA family ATPase [Paludibacteraceae bacterium]